MSTCGSPLCIQGVLIVPTLFGCTELPCSTCRPEEYRAWEAHQRALEIARAGAPRVTVIGGWW